MDKVLLIDGMNLIWRACVSFVPPVQHDMCVDTCQHDKMRGTTHCQCGSPWNDEERFCYGDRYSYVFNFFRNLRPLIEQFEPEKVFFILEGHPQFRYDLYPDYKANRLIKQAASRQEAKDKFVQAREMIIPLMLHLPITTARAAAYEADDTVATLCSNMKEEELTILSADTDYIQLLQLGYPNLCIYNPIKKECMVAPEYPYVAWKAIAGDKSDNIPALLSPKKALKTINSPELFQQFLSVEENRANFTIGRRLIEFAQVPLEDIQLQEGERNFAFLRQTFEMMKFESIIKKDTWERYVKTFDCIKY